MVAACTRVTATLTGGPRGSALHQACHHPGARRAVPRQGLSRRGFYDRMKAEVIYPEHWE